MMPKKLLLSLACLFTLAAFVGAAADTTWLLKVPEKSRAKQNPFSGNSDAAAAGARLFQQNCAQCHGSDGTGRDKKPNLHSGRIRSATPGELEWLLTNGSMKNGMPSWSRLPEGQRWQIVTYVKSLP